MTHWYEVNMNNSRNKSMYGEQRDKDLKALFLKYETEPEPDEEIKETTFSENFETGWVTQLEGELKLKFNETFEIDWFIINSYNNITLENFDTNWFTDNAYTNTGNETFEDESWD